MKKSIPIFLYISCLLFCIGCSSSKLYSSTEEGYSNIASVPGVTFDIPTVILEQATVVTGITEDCIYEDNNYYVYKDGKHSYLIFNTSSFFIIVNNTTNFHITNDKNIKSLFEEKKIPGVQFFISAEEEKVEFNKKNGINKLISCADTKISISPISATLKGKIAYVGTKEYECTLFIGVPEEKYKNLTEKEYSQMEHIVKSLAINEKTIPSIQSSIFSWESNQRETGNGYSDIYHLLSIGERGRLITLTDNNDGAMEDEYIVINALYTGDEAIELIQNYCKTEECLYDYVEAPEGTSWHVVEYTLDYKPDDLYVNIQLKGLDGEQLKYNGKTYSKRTHDIFTYMTYENGKYSKLYCYYAIPDGCQEYMLECGERIEPDDTSSVACYRINGF